MTNLVKYLGAGALLAGLLLAGFGCKGLSQQEVQATKPVTLEYWTVFTDLDALEAALAKYRAVRPYLTVNVRQFRPESIYPELIEALSEDRGPDIVSVRNRSLNQYLSKLAPLPPELSDTIVRVQTGKLGTETFITVQTRPAPTVADLDREFVQVVKKDVVRNGQVYGLPLSLDTLALYYNKDLLDRSGVAEPPKTWEEFQVAVKKITRFDKKTGKILQAGAALGSGATVPGSDDLMFLLLKQSGLTMVDDSGRAVFNLGRSDQGETPVMSVLNFYSDFANPTRDTYAWSDTLGPAFDAFVNGLVGFFFGYSYHYHQLKARAPQLNMGVLPLLQLNPEAPVNVANYWIEVVPGKSRRQNEAWALLDWLARSEANADYLAAAERPTARRALIEGQKQNSALKPFVSDALIAENWYRGNNYEAASGAISQLLKEWLELPPESEKLIPYRQGALDRAAARVNQTL